MKSLGEHYAGRVNVKIYKIGQDFDYIKKYGSTTKSILIINEAKAISKLSKEAIRKAFEEALTN